MLVVADSGSTKCDWVAYFNGKKYNFSTKGINPSRQTKKEIFAILENIPKDLQNHKKGNIFFYSAGCGSKFFRNKLKKCLQKALGLLVKIEIYSDILGCSIAALGKKKGIVAILGTGSIACYYNGKNISMIKGGLGYVLGDEGGGYYLGKMFIKKYFSLKQKEKKTIQNEFNLNKTKIYKKINSKKVVYFLSKIPKKLNIKYNKSPIIKQVVQLNFNKFIDNYLLEICSKNSDNKVNFVGSISFYFKKDLKYCLNKNNIEINSITKKPIEKIFNFHKKKYLETR